MYSIEQNHKSHQQDFAHPAIVNSKTWDVGRTLRNIDSYLGDGSLRFFGAGYRKVSYEINGKTIKDNIAEAKVSIHYPDSWSIKRKNKLRPHLSSIDTLIIATHLCGEFLTRQMGSVNGCDIHFMSIVAGKEPLEDLSSVPVSLKFLGKNSDKSNKTKCFIVSVGKMRVTLEILQDKSRSDAKTSALLRNDYISFGFRDATHKINNILIKNNNYANAEFEKNSSFIQNSSINVIDAFVAGLQLGQVLLYELDNINRSNSNNLWMRSISISKSNFKFPDFKNITTKLNSLHLSAINGERWRSANIVSQLQDIELICSVAHQLPNGEIINEC